MQGVPAGLGLRDIGAAVEKIGRQLPVGVGCRHDERALSVRHGVVDVRPDIEQRPGGIDVPGADREHQR